MTVEKQIDVSVIVPVYNHERYVAKALDSILAQRTHYTYEILIGEDCSTDGSRAIVEEYAKAHPEIIKAFCREKNMGATRNGYDLYMKTQGRYIALLEGDDYWCHEEKLDRQISFLDSHSGYIGVAHNFQEIDANDASIIGKCIKDEDTDRDFTWKDFLRKQFLFQSATLMYHNFFLDGGDYSIIYKSHDLVGDLTVLTILLQRGNIYILPEVMSAYRSIVDSGADNACSIGYRDLALAALKNVRQFDMLRSYLKEKNDFNFWIIEQKAGYLIRMLQHKQGYTWKRWKKMASYGDRETNRKALLLVARMAKNKLLKRDNLYE